jgi:hypothetical protein
MIYLKGFELFLEKKKVVPCNYYDNLKPSSNKESFFRNLTKEKKKKVLQVAGNIFAKCKKELIAWYKDPDTISKFEDEFTIGDWALSIPQLVYDMTDGSVDDSEDEPDVVVKSHKQRIRENLDKWINELKCVVYFDKKQSRSPNAWGVYFSGEKNININLYNFYSDDDTGKANLTSTIRHEIMHTIDCYLQSWGLRTYDKTHRATKSGKEYSKIYNINDKDQFARLQNFRSFFGIRPIDNPKSIGNKLMKAYKAGRIKSDAWKFDLYSDAVNTYFVFIPKESTTTYTPQLYGKALVALLPLGSLEDSLSKSTKPRFDSESTSIVKPRIDKIKGVEKPQEELDRFKWKLKKQNNLDTTDRIYSILYTPTEWMEFKDNSKIKDIFIVDGSNEFDTLMFFSNFSTIGRCEAASGRYMDELLIFVNLNKLTEFNNTTVNIDNKNDVASKTA